MLDAIDTSYRYNSGAMAALGKKRQDDAQDKAQALRQGAFAGESGQLESKVREVAEDFVSVFMNQVMKSMRATVHENPAMHGDNGEKFFQDLLDTEQSKTLAKGSGYGLTDLIYESMMSSYRVQQADARGQTQPVDSIQEAAVETPDEQIAVEPVQ